MPPCAGVYRVELVDDKIDQLAGQLGLYRALTDPLGCAHYFENVVRVAIHRPHVRKRKAIQGGHAKRDSLWVLLEESHRSSSLGSGCATYPAKVNARDRLDALEREFQACLDEGRSEDECVERLGD